MRAYELAQKIRQAINDIKDCDGEPGYLIDAGFVVEVNGDDATVTVLVVGDDVTPGGDRFKITVARRNMLCTHSGGNCL